jgi:D-alanyl-D-alanine carboxypeptidase/D-alanyl-D-alanine-endopeptidase (penicillin-binding protein 4)
LISLKLLVGITALWFNSTAVAQLSLARERICPSDIATEIEAIIETPEQKRSHWGILIETLNSEQILYQLNADQYFIPASNVKLFTTAAALHKLGADYQIRTPIYISGIPPNLTSLRVIGRGDPTLTNEQLKQLAQQLRQMGVRQIEQLIVEDGYLPPPAINPSWEWSDIYSYYAVGVNSLILNENTVVLTILPQKTNEIVKLQWSDPIAARQWQVDNQAITATKDTPYSVEINGFLGEPKLEITGELAIDSQPDIWSLAILKPAQYFGDSLAYILGTEGIIVRTRMVNRNNTNQWQHETKITTIESPNLVFLLEKTNQESNNLFAEVLLKTITTELKSKDSIKVLTDILTELGVDYNSYKLVDGSGLSHHNFATPQALVAILKLMAKTQNNNIFRQSLAVAGVNGTLKNRLQNTSLEGNLQAKTGTLSGISALSGYVEIPDYHLLVFSIIVNKSSAQSSDLRQVIDEIILLISRLRDC